MKNLRALVATLAALTASPAHADVFSDAYQCIKANAKLTLVTAELGPGAVEFVVTKPQCVALVTSPAPVPTGVMVGTVAMANTGVLPKKNPGCENALYTTAAKPVAQLLGQLGILPASINKMIADGVATEAVGAAVQNIPGASVAFASFSCGCGMSSAGVNTDTVKEIYQATMSVGSKCADALGNAIEGGAKGIESAASAAGDILAGQSKHVDPQVYYNTAFRPRLYRDYAVYRNQFQGNLEHDLFKVEPVPQCINYFDKHTMSAQNAAKTCGKLAEQYVAEYKQKVPQMEEARQMTDLRTFGPDSQGLRVQLLGSEDGGPFGKFCRTQNKPHPVYDASKRRTFQYTCMSTAAGLLGYQIKHADQGKYIAAQVSPQRLQARLQAEAANPGGRKAAQIRQQVIDGLYAEFLALAPKAYPAWLSTTEAEEKKDDARNAQIEATRLAEEARRRAEDEAKLSAAQKKDLAGKQAGCKDERCKADIVAYIAGCKTIGGTESAQFQSGIACSLNHAVLHEISARRVALDAKLDAQVKAHLSVACPPDKDCSTGVNKQRADIQAEEEKVWKYGLDAAITRGNVPDAGKAILAEVVNLLKPLEAKTIVASVVPRTFQAVPPVVAGTPPAVTPARPPVVAYTPPVAPSTPVKPVTTLAPPVQPAKPPVVAYTPPVAPSTPVKPIAAKLPPAYTPPPGTGFVPQKSPVVVPPVAASSGPSVAGCAPKSAAESQSLVCSSEAALNRCRSLISSGRVRSCTAAGR